jgi:pimeloyl-ACP methyl ester carboxylesterase
VVATIVIVPGLAVRSYVRGPANALRARGHEVHLLRAPAWRGAPYNLDRYGRILARQLESRGENVALLIGLSVGSQAAAVAASQSPRVQRLLLVSPTVDPRNRTFRKLLGAWLFAPSDSGDPSLTTQLPDWTHAGLARIVGGFLSALRLPIEEVLPQSSASLTIVHAEKDHLGTADWANRLTSDNDGDFMLQTHAPHSWPINDDTGFADVVDSILQKGKRP